MENNYTNQDDTSSMGSTPRRETVETMESLSSTTTTTTPTSTSTGVRHSFRESSPDEIRDRVKDAVQKGIAAVSGALKGFSEEAKKHNLAESTKEAIHKAGETTRQIAGVTATEYRQTREHVKSRVQTLRSGASDTGATGAAGGSTSAPRPLPSPSMGMGGTELGTSTGRDMSNVRGTSMRDTAMQGGSTTLGGTSRTDDTAGKVGTPKVPDLRKVDLGKSDQDLES